MRKGRVVVGVVAACIGAGAAGILVAVAQPASNTVAVPDVVGLHYGAAEAALNAADGLVGLAATDGAACHPADSTRWDIIVAQSPAAGTVVNRGSAVTIYEAGGPPC